MKRKEEEEEEEGRKEGREAEGRPGQKRKAQSRCSAGSRRTSARSWRERDRPHMPAEGGLEVRTDAGRSVSGQRAGCVCFDPGELVVVGFEVWKARWWCCWRVRAQGHKGSSCAVLTHPCAVLTHPCESRGIPVTCRGSRRRAEEKKREKGWRKRDRHRETEPGWSIPAKDAMQCCGRRDCSG